MEAKKSIFFCGLAIVLTVVLASCTTGNCRSEQVKREQAGPEAAIPKENKLLPDPSQVERISVFKPNGSLQCNQGKTIDKAVMEKSLKGIRVYKSSVENDGKLRIQMCGAPTGNVNIFEIDKVNLEMAITLGFAEWIK